MLDYKPNIHYPITERDNIAIWWQTHRDYDINEHREPRSFITDAETKKLLVEEKDYDDYIEIVPRDAEAVEQDFRLERASLLSAFDKWEKAVLRGRESDSELVMSWFKDLLELRSSAFNSIPERIKYYL